MNKIEVTLKYPEKTGGGPQEKVMEMGQTEIMALLMCDVISSQGKCYEPEYKIFQDKQEKRSVYIKLKNCPKVQEP